MGSGSPALFAGGGVGEAGLDVLAGQVGEVGEDLVRHASSQVFEDVLDGDPQAPDARLAEAFSGIDGDDLAPV